MESLKRKADDSQVEAETDDDSANAKRLRRRAKTCALMMMYSGKGYFGMQRNVGFSTIEEELLTALKKSDLISEEHFVSPGKVYFNRASKTDKNVSAAGQVVSIKIPTDVDVTATLNELLPPQIRIIDCIQVTKRFNSKCMVQNRTYMYVAPSAAFAQRHLTEDQLRDFRLSPEAVAQINRLLQHYVGTKNYFNFTSGRKETDKSCVRYMLELSCSEPYVREGLEFVQITIIGQSFMLHQIRKMVALVMSVMGNYTDESIFSRVFNPTPIDIPKAPGLGLLLSSVNYTAYNKRYGTDGIHKPIDWNAYKEIIDDFKEREILSHIYKTEKEENSMFKWRETLHLHTFSDREVCRSVPSSPPAVEDVTTPAGETAHKEDVSTTLNGSNNSPGDEAAVTETKTKDVDK